MTQFTKFTYILSSVFLLIFAYLPTANSSIYSTFPLSFADSNSIRSVFPNENCLLIENYILYDLFSLTDKIRYLNSSDSGYNISYQFCKNIKSSSSVIAEKNGTITKLAGSVYGSENNKNKISINENNKTVTLHLSYGDICQSNNNSKYTFDIELTCDQNIDYEFININDKNELNLNDCTYLLKAKSKYACGDSEKYNVSQDIANARIIIGIFLFIFGNLTGIFGYKELKIAFIILCLLAGMFLFMVIYFLFAINNNIVFYVLVILGLVLGGVVSYFLTRKKKYIKIHMAIMGVALGFLIGIFISEVLISIIETEYQKAIYYTILIIATIAGGVLGLFFSREICILSTSTIGGYSLMKAISCFLVGKVDYFDENEIFDYARTANFEQIQNTIKGLFYIYPAMWIVFTIIYIFIQHKINPKIDDCDDYRELEGKFEKNIYGDDRNNTGSIDEGADTKILP